MQASSWVDRITDETNPWLNAMKMEERGDFGGAAFLYLHDALECLRGDRLSKAALSASCAAMCLDALGLSAQSTVLYNEVAQLYYENARRVAKVSIRELMWSLWQSGQCFLAAAEEEKAEAVYREYATIAGRVALFGENTMVRVFEESGARRHNLKHDQPPPGDWTTLLQGVQQFVNLRRTAIRSAGVPSKRALPRRDDKRGQPSLEKSFVNQLG